MFKLIFPSEIISTDYRHVTFYFRAGRSDVNGLLTLTLISIKI